MYSINRTQSGRIASSEWCGSDVSHVLKWVGLEEDINAVSAYFSYEHFYVIYCKFWELDTDHDFLIDREDLLRYGREPLYSSTAPTTTLPPLLLAVLDIAVALIGLHLSSSSNCLVHTSLLTHCCLTHRLAHYLARCCQVRQPLPDPQDRGPYFQRGRPAAHQHCKGPNGVRGLHPLPAVRRG